MYDLHLICAPKSTIESNALFSSSLALVFFHSHPGCSSCLLQLYPVSASVCAPAAGAPCASDSGRFPLALTAELSVEVSRDAPPCEFGGDSSAVRLEMEAFMGVAGEAVVLGRASSGNISSSSAEECMVESRSGVGVRVRARLVGGMVGGSCG